MKAWLLKMVSWRPNKWELEIMKEQEKVTKTKKKKLWKNGKGDKRNGKVHPSVIVPGRVCALKHIVAVSQYTVRRLALVNFRSTHLQYFYSMYFWPSHTNVPNSRGVASCPESTQVRSDACSMERAKQAYIWGKLGVYSAAANLGSGQHVGGDCWHFQKGPGPTSMCIEKQRAQNWETRDDLNHAGFWWNCTRAQILCGRAGAALLEETFKRGGRINCKRGQLQIDPWT